MNQTSAESTPSVDKAFLNVLGAHRKGAIITDVSAALKQVTAAVQQTGRAGLVTLEMSLRPASQGDKGTLVFEAKVKSKCPEDKPAGSIFYADDDFNLVRNDPNQTELKLRVAETSTATQSAEPLREAGVE